MYDAAPGSVLNLSNDQYIDLDKVTPEDMIASLREEIKALADEMQACKDKITDLIHREPSTIPHPREVEWVNEGLDEKAIKKKRAEHVRATMRNIHQSTERGPPEDHARASPKKEG